MPHTGTQPARITGDDVARGCSAASPAETVERGSVSVPSACAGVVQMLGVEVRREARLDAVERTPQAEVEDRTDPVGLTVGRAASIRRAGAGRWSKMLVSSAG